MSQQTCVLCHEHAGPVLVVTNGDIIGFNCPRCGVFEASGSVVKELRNGVYSSKILERVRIATKNAKSPLKIVSHNIKQLAAEVFIPDSVTDRIDHILIELAQRGGHIGEYHPLDVIQYAGFKFFSAEEFNYARGTLTESGLLQVGTNGYRLTVKGYERVRELTRGKGDGNRVFVAMSFDPDHADIFDRAIKPACHTYGYEAERVDRGHNLNRIDDAIAAGIRGSAFVVADFTGDKAGVYYEAGFAHALGRHVILTCEAAEWSKKPRHFDINHFPFILWKDHADLSQQLKDRILGRIGEFREAQ